MLKTTKKSFLELPGPCMYAEKYISSELLYFLSELLNLFTVAIEKFKNHATSRLRKNLAVPYRKNK